MTRLPWVLLLVLASGCSGGSSGAQDVWDISPTDLASTAAIRLEYGIGGWGYGAAYSFEVDRAGNALYTGGRQSAIVGRYSSRMDSATVERLFMTATSTGGLSFRPTGCADAPTRLIILVQADGHRIIAHAGCGAVESNRTFASTLDDAFAKLDWIPQKRAT
jgi:hypothetical protein